MRDAISSRVATGTHIGAEASGDRIRRRSLRDNCTRRDDRKTYDCTRRCKFAARRSTPLRLLSPPPRCSSRRVASRSLVGTNEKRNKESSCGQAVPAGSRPMRGIGTITRRTGRLNVRPAAERCFAKRDEWIRESSAKWRLA